MPRTFSARALSVAWWVLALVVVVGMALLCWRSIHQTLDHPITFQLADAGSPKLTPITGGPSHATLSGDVTVGVQISHPSSQLQWLLALSVVNASFLQTAVVLVLGIIWARTSSGRPFARTVTRSLAALALVLLVFGTLQDALGSWINLREEYEAVGNNTNLQSAYYYQGGFDLSGVWLLAAIAIWVLAGAFAIGARLAKETDGLV